MASKRVHSSNRQSARVAIGTILMSIKYNSAKRLVSVCLFINQALVSYQLMCMKCVTSHCVTTDCSAAFDVSMG